MNLRIFILVALLTNEALALLKTCSPSFHESFLSGGDELKMRWEYCTKMTFSRTGYAEWHSMASYKNSLQFNQLFVNYMNDYRNAELDQLDPNKHLLQLDLAIYDQSQWDKIMYQIEEVKQAQALEKIKKEAGVENDLKQTWSAMSCHERLSHAIHVDKIKIFPNSTSIIEKTQKRHIQESYYDRVLKKSDNNEYASQSTQSHEVYDWKATHDDKLQDKDQAWYFVLADCDGALEIMQDEKTKKEHLLGLSHNYKEIEEKDYLGYEELDENLTQNEKEFQRRERKMRFQNTNLDADSFEETNLMMENQRRERIQEMQQKRLDRINDELDKGGDGSLNDDDFDFEQYLDENNLDDLEKIGKFSKSHHLKLKSVPVKVQLQIFNTGSHFSEDKFNLAILYAILWIGFMALTMLNHKKYAEDRDRFEEEDSPLYFTFGSLNMIVTHCSLKCLHNFYYSQDGVGSMLSEMFAHIMLVFSRITMITILIAFAFGWQVIYENTLEVKKKIQWVYIFILLMTAYDDYALSKHVEQHPNDLFHLFTSNIQWTFYATKLVEYLIFLFALWRSKRVNNQKLEASMEEIDNNAAGDQKELELQETISTSIYKIRAAFFNQLWLVGTIFFASTPASIIISTNFIQESNQQMFQILIITVAQVIVYGFLLYMLTNKSSKYYSATFRGQSILPGKVS